jgi:hypothetical protein
VLLGHPLTSEAHQHDKHCHPKPFVKRTQRGKIETKWDAHDLHAIDKATKIIWEGEPMRQAKKGPSRAFAKLNHQSHKSQLGDKMIKSKGNNMGKAKNMGVMSQGREKTERKNT